MTRTESTDREVRRARAGALVLLAIGIAQPGFDLAALDRPALVASAFGASPAPRELAARRGVEPYAGTLTLRWTQPDGSVHEVALTPARLGGLRGPAARRSFYGALLARGPALAGRPETLPLVASAAAHALCGDAPLLAELGVALPRGARAIRVERQPAQGGDALALEAPCR
jgi:hypothetical protein